jgi:dihydrofolate synthase/folylpolyglutamate synthase
MEYEQALQYIKDCSKFGLKLGLERIGAILERLGHPERQFPSIHIAGTNGKGSTTAMFEVALSPSHRIGRFTSPHLSSYRERFVIDGQMIAETELAELVSELKPVLEAVSRDGFGDPTEFEVGTALAFLYFARHRVDLALIEVGMGGRFDATNIIRPILSVITHIALDHQQYLGDTLEQIAFEKAGIIKPGIPVVIGVQEPEIEAYLAGIARARDSRYALASAIAIRHCEVAEGGTVAEYAGTLWGTLRITLGLLGRHQAQNCLNLLAALEFLKEAGFGVKKSQLLDGLAQAAWPGRLERMRNWPEHRLYLDGAHNPDGARALVAAFQEIYPGRKAILLVGVLGNRPLAEMAGIFSAIAERVVVTTVPDPKSAPPDELADIFRRLGVEAWAEPEPERALRKALAMGNPLVLASGSLYLIGWLRSLILGTGD